MTAAARAANTTNGDGMWTNGKTTNVSVPAIDTANFTYNGYGAEPAWTVDVNAGERAWCQR